MQIDAHPGVRCMPLVRPAVCVHLHSFLVINQISPAGIAMIAHITNQMKRPRPNPRNAPAASKSLELPSAGRLASLHMTLKNPMPTAKAQRPVQTITTHFASDLNGKGALERLRTGGGDGSGGTGGGGSVGTGVLLGRLRTGTSIVSLHVGHSIKSLASSSGASSDWVHFGHSKWMSDIACAVG